MSVRPAPLPIAFVAFQTDNRANGGVASLTHIVDHLEGVAPLMITQRETEVTAHWRARGYSVNCWPLPSPFPLDGEPPSSRASRGISMLEANVRLGALFRAQGVRLVHCNDFPALSIAAPAARALGIPVVHNIRDTLGVTGFKWKLGRALANRIVVLSREMRAIVEAELALPSWFGPRFGAPIDVVYSIVDPARMRPASFDERAALRAKLGIAEDELALGVVAAVVEKKQQRELLEFLRQNPERLPAKARLYFVGDFRPDVYSYARECEAISRLPGLAGRAHFTGYTDQVEDWYRSLDCTLIPSSQEGLARAMVESIACGTPVASFAVCSAHEILTEHECGVVVDQGDFAALFQAVRRFSEHPEERRRLAERGPEIAGRWFAPEAVAASYQRIYQSLVDGELAQGSS
jgi:glycosyltransferase involved in cell wall biosynthesis